MAVVVCIVAHVFSPVGAGAWMALILGGGLGVAAYWALLELMGVSEIRQLSNLLPRR